MSRITKEEIEKTKCGRFLLSDENIYLSIYSLNSYVFEYNLLNTEDRILYHRLQDKFDARLINGVITRVREQIIELFDKDKYIEAKVYFKPKKLSENGELEFRPLHSTGLITQIAIVSMLHLFVYEIPEEEEGDPKLRLSNLSRLIPSDFYGNRVSVKPEYLFKPWKQQYQKYNQNSNDALMKYHTSLEYKYEVTLDLENFFPTINPIIIYRYIINHLPAYLNDEERKMMKRVLQKLLFCKLTTTFDEKTAGQYYKVTKGAGNYDNVDKIEQNEKECWAFKEKSDKFVRGIPQGLPQSYFLGNIYMISIAEIFRKKFTGVSYFYVDDSVIFTNDVREDNFKEQLKELNKQIADEASNLIYLHMRLEEFYKSIDKNKVNVFFIEEPESHMHPQMQNVFVRFLKNYYIDKKLQGLITTHSNEIARVVGLDSLRVIRQTEKSKSELFDLSKFRTSIKEKKIENLDDESEFLLTNFFDWFFEIGYSELIFADKAILYEGDSERLYIRKLIKLPEFSTLNDSYIAYIQVGGAYAHNYLPMLRMLKMKTLIITDLDYDKEILSMDKVKAEDSKSTNATINHCYRLVYPNKEENYFPTIKELYDFQVKEENILCDGRVYLAFQDEDSTARTLEEAMLKKILGFNVFHMIKRSEWKKIRKDKNLIFSIPNNKKGEKDSEYSIRKIVEATSNNKTDFMYSVILSENEEKMLPDYIKKGLLWLMK